MLLLLLLLVLLLLVLLLLLLLLLVLLLLVQLLLELLLLVLLLLALTFSSLLSWGSSVNNSWEFNAVHDNEGYAGLEILFADDFTPSLTMVRLCCYLRRPPALLPCSIY